MSCPLDNKKNNAKKRQKTSFLPRLEPYRSVGFVLFFASMTHNSLLLSLLFVFLVGSVTASSPCPGSFPTTSYNLTSYFNDNIRHVWVDASTGMTRQDFVYPAKTVTVILKGEMRYNIIKPHLKKMDPPVCYYCEKDKDGFSYWQTPVMTELLDAEYTSLFFCCFVFGFGFCCYLCLCYSLFLIYERFIYNLLTIPSPSQVDGKPAIACLGKTEGRYDSDGYFFTKDAPYTPLGTLTNFWSDIFFYKEITTGGYQPSSLFEIPTQCFDSTEILS